MEMLDKFIRSGFAAALLIFGGLIAGVIASVYSPEIKSGGWYTLGFGFSCVIFFVLLFSRELFIQNKTELIQKKTEEYQDVLLETIRTMPPKNILSTFSTVYTTLSTHLQKEVYSLDDSDGTKLVKVDEGIRFALECLSSLIAAFEQYPNNVVYSANIMLFRTVDEIVAAGDSSEVLAKLKFAYPKTLDGLLGVLELDLLLSCRFDTSSESDSGPDTTRSPLALPIPKHETQVPNKTRFLPGAPTVFAQGHPVLIEDTAQIAATARLGCDVTHSVITELESYFHSGGSASLGSILCLRVDKSDPKLGIINLNCDKQSILKNDDQLYTYSELANPLTDSIRRLLGLRSKLQQTR
ncbi:MAG: hypothetical protein ACI93R_002798 [Flavobacteriales bacterium]|jgi:hypothetical protein